MSRILFLDIETTGFSRDWNEVLEVAAIVWDDVSNTIVDSFHEYIKPLNSFPAKITELTGITKSFVANCRNERYVLMDFSEWLAMAKPKTIIGHNCKAFDLGFLARRCEKLGIGWNTNNATIIDTLALARDLNKRKIISTENNKQETLAKYFGVVYNAHSAIEDVKALIQIYYKMLNIENEEDVGF